MKKILLSIGIIFKNEIRCLERCLKSLQPLRDAIPCEVVMADTGASDGSREVAEKYADILIDFPWINDFSAARNAVMDCCSGEWFMTIDCDEWVDKNIEGFVAFLTGKYDFDFASVIIRNYDTPKLDEGGSYSDFLATRLLRMSTGLRYEGSIHEHWHYKGDLRTMMIRGAVFHHDGYVYQDKEKWRKKQARNMEPLRQQLEKDPENLVILNQCVESSAEMPEQEGYLRRALAGTDEKWSQWELFGPSIYRYAVRMALRDSLPELEDWIRKAEEMFPNSIFTRVEVAYFAFGHYWNTDDYPQALHWGEKYLQGVEDYHAGRFDRADLLASSLDKTDTHSRLSVATVLASGYLHEEQPEKCVQLMEKLDPAQMNAKQIMDCVRNFGQLRHAFRWDTDRQIRVFWERLSEPVPDRKQAQERQTAFLQAGSAMFTREYRETEAFAYTVFLPLEGMCPLGIAAAILQTVSPEELETQLGRIEHWDEVPVQALMHALEQGAAFPLPDKPLDMETMAGLAARLAQDQQRFLPLALRLAERRERPELVWLQLLLAAAVRSYPWGGKEQEEAAGMTLARAFARMEQEFLPLYYAEDTLREERLFTLPALHRLGWYCVRAFDALDAGDTAGYVRLLREGLNACEGMKPLVEFLMDHTPELQKPAAPSAELLALAEQVRTILAQFPSDDPAVMALKQSEAYRQVAYLIEEEAPPVRTNRVLMAAYFFPPLSGSGVFRSLKFAKYLPEFGWQPTVISTDQPPSGWKFEDQSQVSEIPKDMEVVRIPDEISTGRNMTIAGERVQELLDFLRSVVRYSPEADRIFAQMAQSKEGISGLLTFPCASLSWAYDVVQYIEKNINLKQFQAVYTTSGPASAHLIGFYLKQKYGISWVADYRDPWTFNAYGAEYDPKNTYHKFLYELESVLLHQADCNLTIADDMIPSYQQNFHLPLEQIASITNGYDEADFANLPLPAHRTEKFTINYSGVLYTDQRSIKPVLEALRQLGREGKMELSQVCFRIVGVGVEEYGAVARPYGLEHILVQTGYLSHRDALLSNLNADLLLLLVGDGAKFRHVFTGKFFDYLRSGRPILALAPKDGAVDRVLRESGHGETYLSTEIPKIKAMILREYRKWKRGEVPVLLHSPVIERFERKTLTRQLADVLDTAAEKSDRLTDTVSRMPAVRHPKYLVICNGGYPMEGNPRCMFAHERVLQYIKAGLDVEAFGFIWGAPWATYEYQGVKVTQGGAEELKNLLQNEKYEKLLIHFVDQTVLYAIQLAGKLDMPMIIWCHGYEVLPWYRCWFNYSTAEIAANQTALNEENAEKKKFLEMCYAQNNLQFVFVSNWQMQRSQKFVGKLPVNHQVIHNFINCDYFASPPKLPQDRFHILSIKGHASRMYANDLTAKAIMELSNRSWFSNVTFELCGDGRLFMDNFSELMQRNFSNVHIHRGFLSHSDMRRLFRENGIFLSPTRMDSHQITTSEAMAAGMAVVTSSAGPIREFMNEDCGSLFEFDNYWMMAEDIEYLCFHPEEFLRKSQNAVQRIRTQCSYEQTIGRELKLITG